MEGILIFIVTNRNRAGCLQEAILVARNLGKRLRRTNKSLSQIIGNFELDSTRHMLEEVAAQVIISGPVASNRSTNESDVGQPPAFTSASPSVETQLLVYTIYDMEFQNIPVELACAIVEHAARMFIADQRSWVVQLSFVSRFVAQSLRPILHYSVIVDSRNTNFFIRGEARHIVLSFARKLTIRHAVSHDVTQAILAVWKPHVGSFLNVPWNHIQQYMRDCPDARSLRGIEIRYEWLARAITGRLAAPPVALAQLTRVIAYVPTYWRVGDGTETLSARDWARAVADNLPALRHLGLDLLETATEWPFSGVASRGPQSESYLVTLRDVLLALLEFNPHLSITVRVAGEYLKRRSMIDEIIVASMPKNLVNLYYDPRSVDSWDDVEKIQADDAWHLRDCFTDLSKIEFEVATSASSEPIESIGSILKSPMEDSTS